MKEYMRGYRKRMAGSVDNRLKEYAVDKPDYRAAAQYDPSRDGYLEHENVTSQLMGDPPIGRRALDART
jgi:hypothetical protein